MSWLKLIPRGVWLAAAMAALVAAGWLYVQTIQADRDDAVDEAAQMTRQVDMLSTALDAQRARAERLDAALEERAAALSEARAEVREHRHALAQLERDNEEIREWADDRLPDAVADWVRKLPADHRAGDGDARGAGEAD
ncbi:MAG: hypothetical protein ACOC0M_00225 [Halomonas sp.]